MKTEPINPHRLRRVPKQFSWIDQRLVRLGYLQHCDHRALSLYLFYLTVSDAQGMSYYADKRLMTMLSMTAVQLDAARHSLVTQGLIAYRKPFVQVLSLDNATTPATSVTSVPQNQKATHESHRVENHSRQEDAKANMKKLQAQLRNGVNETNGINKRKSK